MKTKEQQAAYNRTYRLKNAERIRERNRKFYRDNIERITEYQRQYRRDNSERISDAIRQWQRDNPDKRKAISLRYYERNKEQLAMRTRDARRTLREDQAPRPRPDVCEVCSRPPGKRALSFDHSHATGAFRGWLCSQCNTSLGLAGDNPEILDALAAYLRRDPAIPPSKEPQIG